MYLTAGARPLPPMLFTFWLSAARWRAARLRRNSTAKLGDVMSSIVKSAVVNSLSTALYVGMIGSLLFYAGQMRLGQSKTVLVPIAMLLLLVFSAGLVVPRRKKAGQSASARRHTGDFVRAHNRRVFGVDRATIEPVKNGEPHV